MDGWPRLPLTTSKFDFCCPVHTVQVAEISSYLYSSRSGVAGPLGCFCGRFFTPPANTTWGDSYFSLVPESTTTRGFTSSHCELPVATTSSLPNLRHPSTLNSHHDPGCIMVHPNSDKTHGTTLIRDGRCQISLRASSTHRFSQLPPFPFPLSPYPRPYMTALPACLIQRHHQTSSTPQGSQGVIALDCCLTVRSSLYTMEPSGNINCLYFSPDFPSIVFARSRVFTWCWMSPLAVTTILTKCPNLLCIAFDTRIFTLGSLLFTPIPALARFCSYS